MNWLIAIGIFIVLLVINLLIPEYKPKCDLCKDNEFIEVNIWDDEVITVDCPKCKK
jgi:hypothetical protein